MVYKCFHCERGMLHPKGLHWNGSEYYWSCAECVYLVIAAFTKDKS